MVTETDAKGKEKKRLKAGDIRRRRVVREMIANGGKTRVSEAMRAAGYSEGYAHNPQKFLNTKANGDLLEQFFPDEYLHAKTKELMEASELDSYTFPSIGGGRNKKGKNLTNEEIRYIVEEVAHCTLVYVRDSTYPDGRIAFFRAPAWKARKDGVDIAYKLKGAFVAEGQNPKDRNPFAAMSDAELAAAIKEAKDVLTKKK